MISSRLQLKLGSSWGGGGSQCSSWSSWPDSASAVPLLWLFTKAADALHQFIGIRYGA